MSNDQTRKQSRSSQNNRLLEQFAKDFCRQNQLPAEQIKELQFLPAKNRSRIELQSVQPSGALSGIIESLLVDFDLWEPATGNKNVRSARVHYHYEHTQAGSNGYALRLSVLTRPDADGLPEYVGFVSDDILSAFVNGMPRE